MLTRVMRRQRWMAIAVLCAVCAAADSGAPSGKQRMVYFGTTERIRGFDPVVSSDTTSIAAISKVYEGLYEFEYLARPYAVRPLLAEAMPEISADGLTYTIRIKRGVRFADNPCFPGGKGRELTAEDFVYSWKRVTDVRTRSSCYWIFEGRVAGLDDFHNRTAEGRASYDDRVEGLQPLDRYTLQIRLTQPYPQLIWILAMSYTFVVAREAVNFYGAEFLNHPVGTGAFRLKDWKWRNYRIVFERNPTYHGDTYPTRGEPADRERGLLDDAGKPVPFLDAITEYVITDESTAWLMFLSGRLDRSGIGRDNFDSVVTAQRELTTELKARGIVLEQAPQLTTAYLGFYMDDPVTGASRDPAEDQRHRKLRQALGYAINTEQWTRFYNGRLLPANSVIPPGIAGHDPAKPLSTSFDLPRARQLLAEAGYPDGRDLKSGRRLTLTLEVSGGSDPQLRQEVDMLGSFFDRIGVVLQPVYSNHPEFLKKVERRQFQIVWAFWAADYPDAENFLQLFYSPNAAPGPNWVCYNNPGFDRLFERARQMPDSPERTALYQQLADIVNDDCPWIAMTYRQSVELRQPWLKIYKPHAFPYPFFKFYRIDSSPVRP